MTLGTMLDKIRDANRLLTSLLDHPEEGLSSWREAVGRTLRELAELAPPTPYTGGATISVGRAGPPPDDSNVIRRTITGRDRSALVDAGPLLPPEGEPPAKFVQLAGTSTHLYALDETGRVWWHSGAGWVATTTVRLEGAPPKPAPKPPVAIDPALEAPR